MRKFTTKLKMVAKGLLIGGLILAINPDAFSQTFKEKMLIKKNALVAKTKKDNSEMYQCGHVYKEKLGTKLNPMRAMQKGMGNSFTDGGNSDLGKTAITVFYQAHLYPGEVMKYLTKTPGWETCGDAVYAGFTNRSGIGLSSTDGQFLVDGVALESAGMGTYFHGFKPDQRGPKSVKITSSNGNVAEVTVLPPAPVEIISVDGKVKGEELIIDGTKDIVIQLENGDADPKSNLYVQLLGNLMGTAVMFDIIVTKAKNTITIPKEAFKNFEGSPSPFAKENILVVNRITETIIEGTDAGAIRTINGYMDWMPMTVGGDLSKGSIMTAGFDSTKNTSIDIKLMTDGEYNFAVKKEQPYYSPPIKLIKKVAFASFVVRGNLTDQNTTVTSGGGWTTTTKTTKWFPELSDDTWEKLANKMYAEVTMKLKTEMGWDILPLNTVVNSEAYKHIKPIAETATKNFVEVGAGDTKRILTTSGADLWEDLSITFGGDFVSQRLVKELDVDAVLAITVDLNFNFETEGLDPVFSIVAFAPDVSYKTSAKYFSMSGNTQAKPLAESRKYTGGVENVLYQMMKMDQFNTEFIDALKELSKQEDQYPVYEKLWGAKL
jgi:hypothetical protein